MTDGAVSVYLCSVYLSVYLVGKLKIIIIIVICGDV